MTSSTPRPQAMICKTPGQPRSWKIRLQAMTWGFAFGCFGRFSVLPSISARTRSRRFGKISKNSRLARPRLYNAGAFSYDAHAAARGGTPGRPRQDFHFDFWRRSMRRNSPQTARADDRGGAEMIKIRVQGLPEEVAEFADALEASGCVLERSEPYANRGGSSYVRVYIDAQKPAAGGVAREIEEG